MKTVTLLGMGSTMLKCRYDTDEVWGVNSVYKMAKKLDKLFITDPKLNYYDKPNHDFAELNALNIPIVSLHKFKELKKLVHYPYDKIVARWGSEFFTNSICYMVAYALYNDYKLIKMCGIDMATSMEYILERGGIEFWVGVGTGMGVKFDITKQSMVCKPPMGIPYGHKLSVNMKEVDPYGLCNPKAVPSQ